MEISVELRPCQTSVLKSIPFTIIACLDSSQIFLFYFPYGTSARMAKISANVALAFVVLSMIVNLDFSFSWKRSPNRFVLFTLYIFSLITFNPGHLPDFLPTCITQHFFWLSLSFCSLCMHWQLHWVHCGWTFTYG